MQFFNDSVSLNESWSLFLWGPNVTTGLVCFNEPGSRGKTKFAPLGSQHEKAWEPSTKPSESSCSAPVRIPSHSFALNNEWYTSIIGMLTTCCFNNKILQISRKNHGGIIHCPLTSRKFSFTASMCSRPVFQFVHRCEWMHWLNDATQLWLAWGEHALLFMDEVLGMKTKSWMVGGLVKERWRGGRMNSILLLSTKHEIHLYPFNIIIARSLWEIRGLLHYPSSRTSFISTPLALDFIQTFEMSRRLKCIKASRKYVLLILIEMYRTGVMWH